MKLRRFAALAGAMVLTLGIAGVVSADSGNPENIHATVSGQTVTVTADWTWTKCTGTKIVGWAVAWGDADFQQNPVPDGSGGFFYMGDAVQGNHVFNAGTPCSGTSGALGSLSHTYATAGTKDVCVIVYDMVKDTKTGAFPTSGAHSDVAGGPDRNTDNSVEQNELKGESICLSPDIPVVVPVVTPAPTAVPTATPVVTPKPSGGVQGETNVPHTAPPTDTFTNTTSDPGSTLPLILIVLGIIGLAAVVLTPGRAKR